MLSMIKRMGMAISVLMVISISLLLFGCASHQNQLLAMPKHEAAQQLLDASLIAERGMKITPASGAYYGECMTGKASVKRCGHLFALMQQNLVKNPSLQHTTIADLKSKLLWQRVQNDYQEAVFNHV